MDRRNSRTFVSASTVDLAGVSIAIELGSEPRAAAFEGLLGTLPLTSEAPQARVIWTDEPASVPSRASDYPHDDGLEYWAEADCTVYRYAGVTAVVTDEGITLGGDASPLELPFRYVFEPALTHVLARHGRFMLHAGAITRGETALLLIGESGQGKSTLCWAAAGDGWSLLSDDHTILQRTADGLRISGLPKPIHIPEELMAEPQGELVERYGRRRRQLPATMLGSGWHHLDAVVRPRHGDTATGALEAAPADELLPLLIGSFAALGQPDLLRQFFPEAAALTRLPCWDLFHATHLEDRLTAAAGWLDVVRQRA